MFRNLFWSLSLFLYRLQMQVVIVKNGYVPVPWKTFWGKKSQPLAAMLFLALMSPVQSLTLLGVWKQKYGLTI